MARGANITEGFRVMLWDGSMPVETRSIFLDNVSKAVAKSIERHTNREISRLERKENCQINVHYYVEHPDDYEPDLEYWR